ncbi:hypothetical protein RGUI_0824 [Rhodovulum sp. P5]|uniref:hypothetical protein n=1 Tax=Rhodovulum phage vB_RhkS_P1 TaxID=1873452 RepID=UPI00080ABA4A|nr:hypothetical protein [Rhodovulum sp. P5]YP_009285909.1 hypothetical protein BI026_gp24 [Rhodovulum phage vB_RhkS_P1]ANT39894.1 hypothetical protein Rhks_24 [Rhodovulum phage vB_RhkS_P1]ARE38965.1 hypothetical protein RGUI_0824 [Rhodovulum sp. P5]
MIDTLFLAARIAAYALGGALAHAGYIQFDPATGEFVGQIAPLGQLVGGAAVTVGTFGASRVAKRFGWAT